MNKTAPSSPDPLGCLAGNPEARFLLLVARYQIAPVDAVELLSLTPDVDWNRVLEEAQSHGLTASLLNTIRSHSLPAPSWVSEALQARQFAWDIRLLGLTEELLKLARLLSAHQVEMLAFKGPVLGMQAFGRMGWRMSWDLDFIVRQRDVATVRALLEAAGYQLISQGDGAQDYHFHLQHPNGFAVEIHWAITPNYLPFPIQIDDLFLRSETVTLGGTPLKAVTGEELVLLLCVHGAKHCWERLGWIRDIAALLKRRPDLDWNRLLSLARDTGSLRMLLLGIVLAEQLLGSKIPRELASDASRDAVLPKLVRRVVAQLAEKNGETRIRSLERPDFLIRLRERRRDRAIYLWHWLKMSAKPNEADLQLVALPRQFSGLYYLIRPIRVLAKYVHLLIAAS